MPVDLDIAAVARRFGGYAWLELQLFSLLGEWAASTPEPAVKVLMGTQSHRHGWHARLWLERLPELREVRPEDMVGPSDDGPAAVVGALTRAEATIERLVGIAWVLLPRLAADYAELRDETDPRLDGPTARVLQLVSADIEADERHAGAVLDALLVTEADRSRAVDHATRLEAMLRPPG